MPYKLSKTDNGQYFVVDDTGKKYSDKPMSKWKAARQMRALYAAEKKGKKESLKQHDGVMIAWMLPEAMAHLLQLTAKNAGVAEEYLAPVDEMHMTIFYLGDIGSLTKTREEILQMIEKFTKTHVNLMGTINGTGQFTQTHIADTSALIALVDVPGLPEFYQDLVDYLGGAGVIVTQNHGFTPHITLAYLPQNYGQVAVTMPPLQVDIDMVCVAWGDMRFYYTLLKPKAAKEFSLEEASTSMRGEISVFKQLDDTWRWVAYSSNAFRDGDREIVSEKALQADCDYADQTKAYGPLRWWHVRGADLGDCDFNAMHGKILIESGTFRYPAIAERVKEQAPNLQISIGFNRPLTEPDRDGVFHHIKRFERSLLPRGRASNPLTALPIVNRGGNQMLQEKLKALGALLGGNDDLVNLVLSQAEKTEKEALAAGTTFKENEKPADPTPPGRAGQASPETPTPNEKEAPAAEKPAEPENAMGDMTPEAFAGMLATMLQKAIAPLTADIAMLKEAQSKKDDTEASIKTAAESQAKNIKAIGDRVKELEGEQPRAAQAGYRASQDSSTVVKETSTVKGMKPEIDPTFVAFLKSG